MTNAPAELAREAPPRAYFPYTTGRNAQRIAEFVTMRLGPAATAAAITYSHLISEWQALLVFASMLGVVTLLRSPNYPLHLVPIASATLYLLAPPLGAVLAMGVTSLDGDHVSNLTAAEMVTPVLAAWVVTGLGAWLTSRLRRDRQVRVAVIGTHEFARSLEAELDAVGVRGYRVVGCIDPEHSCSTAAAAGVRCLGSLVLLRHTVLEHGLELLVLGPLSPTAESSPDSEFKGAGPSRLDVFETVADACLDLPVSMIEAGQLYEQLFGHVPLGTTTSAWFQYLLHPSYKSRWPVSKRLFDVALGLIAGAIALPIVAIAALAVRLVDGSPVLYRQRRIGARGREFELVKLRTMYRGAEAMPGDDEHVTPLGRWLRRLHIDELPQLWLVLKGQMSLVGPRPEQPSIVTDLESRFSYYDRRHLIKPGITGWAQVRCGYAGSHIGSAWKLCHDLYYLKRHTLLFDLLILLETTSTIVVPEPINRPDERFIVGTRSEEELPATVETA